MQRGMPREPVRSMPDTPERACEELARLLRRTRPGIEEDLGCPEGCSDKQLVESLLKHDSPFALLRSLGFDSGAASVASRLLKEARLTPRVRDLARSIEAKIAPAPRPSPPRTLVKRKSGTLELQDESYDWRREVPDPRVAPARARDAGPPPSRATGFYLGQAVRAAFTEDGLQMAGVVTCLEPLQVQPHGIAESFEFVHVEAMGANVDAVMQAANKCADKCPVNAPSVETDLRALDMARLCLQQGMPQLAKVFMDMVSVTADAKAEPNAAEGWPEEASRADEDAKTLELPKLSLEPIPTPTMVGIVEEEEEEEREGEALADEEKSPTPVPLQELAEPEFEPTALETLDGIVNDEGAPVALGADGVRYRCGRALRGRGAEGGRCGQEDGPQCDSCRRLQDCLEAPFGSRFAEGQRVAFADHEADEWKKGVVTCVDPLLIRPDGYKESFDFNLVERLDSWDELPPSARVGVQDASSSGGAGGVRAERLSASNTLLASSPSGASSKGTPPLHELGKTIDTCASHVQGLSATLPPPSRSTLSLAMLPSPKGDEKTVKSSWLACCFAR